MNNQSMWLCNSKFASQKIIFKNVDVAKLLYSTILIFQDIMFRWDICKTNLNTSIVVLEEVRFISAQ